MTSPAEAINCLMPSDEFMAGLTGKAADGLRLDLARLAPDYEELIRKRQQQSDTEREAERQRTQAADQVPGENLADRIHRESNAEMQSGQLPARPTVPPAPASPSRDPAAPLWRNPDTEGDDRPSGVRTVPSRSAPHAGEDGGRMPEERHRQTEDADNHETPTDKGWRRRMRVVMQTARGLARNLGMHTGDN